MKKVLAAVFASLVLAAPAIAVTSTNTLNVSADVTALCTVNSPTLAFGTYTGAALGASTTVTITCTSNTAAGDIGIDSTQNLTNGTDILNYDLFQDGAYTTAWGSTTGTDTVPFNLGGTATTASFTLYGQIPQGQAVSTGTYTGTRTITVNY